MSSALTRVIQSSAGRDALQDQVISVRGDRLVVQVKAEMRHRIPGIVHDASNTGATLFVEPSSTVDLCNAWRELSLEEGREVARVLRDLSALVGGMAEDIRRGNELTAAPGLHPGQGAVRGLAGRRQADGGAAPTTPPSRRSG